MANVYKNSSFLRNLVDCKNRHCYICLIDTLYYMQKAYIHLQLLIVKIMYGSFAAASVRQVETVTDFGPLTAGGFYGIIIL